MSLSKAEVRKCEQAIKRDCVLLLFSARVRRLAFKGWVENGQSTRFDRHIAQHYILTQITH